MTRASSPGFARVIAGLILAIGLFAAISMAAVFCISEWKLHRSYDAPLTPINETLVSPDLAEGERMAKIVGCWAGCHGMVGQGGSIDMAGYYTVTAPTLSSVLPLYNDTELTRLVRFGIKRDGSSALGMTSYTFFPIGNSDLANITAHLRRQPLLQAVVRKRSISWVGRFKLSQGSWQLAADQVDSARPRWGELPRTNAFERGRYLASITCSECHGVDFRGNEFEDNNYDGGPSLAIIAIYSADEFSTLMRTGVPIGGRDLGEMSWVARNGFVHFTDQEVDDVRAFLRKHHGLPEEVIVP